MNKLPKRAISGPMGEYAGLLQTPVSAVATRTIHGHFSLMSCEFYRLC